MSDSNNWLEECYQSYRKFCIDNEVFRKAAWTKADGDHTHCLFDAQKISNYDIDDNDKQGYCGDKGTWFCASCFEELIKRHNVKVEKNTISSIENALRRYSNVIISLNNEQYYLKNKDEYFKLCAMLFTGMTVFLVISTIYPNGHYLRPAYFEHNNIFIQMVKWLYATDTPTNLFPSVHVFNSIAVNIAVWHSDNFKKNKAVRYGSAVLMVLIILSTMFLKQHSVFDVVTGMVLAVFMYSVVYTTNWAAVTVAKPVRKPRQI